MKTNKSVSEIKHILTGLIAEGRIEFGTTEVSEICNISTAAIHKYVALHPEIRPKNELSGRAGGYRWTADEILRLVEYRADKSNCNSETAIAIPEPTPTVTANAEYVSPIDVLIAIDKTMTDDPNVKAYYDLKSKFERMNESALQKLFAPILNRFKFAYICKQIPEIQSQTLTCIHKGKLRGLEKYNLDFNAFLKLIKFAHDNCVPLDAVDEQNNH